MSQKFRLTGGFILVRFIPESFLRSFINNFRAVQCLQSQLNISCLLVSDSREVLGFSFWLLLQRQFTSRDFLTCWTGWIIYDITKLLIASIYINFWELLQNASTSYIIFIYCCSLGFETGCCPATFIQSHWGTRRNTEKSNLMRYGTVWLRILMHGIPRDRGPIRQLHRP